MKPALATLAVLVAVGLGGCGTAEEGEREVLATESPEPAFTPAPYVGRFEDPCDALPADARRVSSAMAEADRAELSQALGQKGVETIGLSTCGDVSVVLVGVSDSMTRLPATGTRGTPVLMKAQPPIRAL